MLSFFFFLYIIIYLSLTSLFFLQYYRLYLDCGCQGFTLYRNVVWDVSGCGMYSSFLSFASLTPLFLSSLFFFLFVLLFFFLFFFYLVFFLIRCVGAIGMGRRPGTDQNKDSIHSSPCSSLPCSPLSPIPLSSSSSSSLWFCISRSDLYAYNSITNIPAKQGPGSWYPFGVCFFADQEMTNITFANNIAPTQVLLPPFLYLSSPFVSPLALSWFLIYFCRRIFTPESQWRTTTLVPTLDILHNVIRSSPHILSLLLAPSHSSSHPLFVFSLTTLYLRGLASPGLRPPAKLPRKDESSSLGSSHWPS